jgi:hypothetical protein
MVEWLRFKEFKCGKKDNRKNSLVYRFCSDKSDFILYQLCLHLSSKETWCGRSVNIINFPKVTGSQPKSMWANFMINLVLSSFQV